MVNTFRERESLEAETLRALIGELQEKIDDPLADSADVEHAEALIANACDRLKILDDKNTTVTASCDVGESRKGGYLLPGEDRITVEGKSYVVNESGHAEPDIANPVPVTPGDKVIEPKQLDLSLTIQKQDAPSVPATKADFEKIVRDANALGVDANVVASLWSQLQLNGFGSEYTKGGLYTLEIMVLNRFMQNKLEEVYTVFNEISAKMTASRKPKT